MEPNKFDAEEFLRELCERLRYRFPHLNESLEDPNSTYVMSFLADALTTEIPPLQRVLTFSMWMSLDFVRNVAGITDGELEEISETPSPNCPFRVTPDRLLIASSITIQQWNTHTVIIDGSGSQEFIYEPEPWAVGDFHVIREHTLNCNASLELVFYEDAIKCWARGGRFGYEHGNSEAMKENVFIEIPLDESELEKFLWTVDDSVRPEDRPDIAPWEKCYRHEDADRCIGWNLHILDNIARVNWP